MIYNTNGNSKISLSFDGYSSWLNINNTLIAINVAGPIQNVPNSFHVRCNFESNYVNEILDGLEFDFNSSFNLFESKSDKIERLLSFFEPGQYHIASPVYNNFGIGCFLEDSYKLLLGDFDPQLAPFNCVRNKQDLDFTIIESFKQKIKQGINPIVLAYRKDYGSETGASFILDGHHKLIAYHELKTKPKIWEIVKLQSEVYDKTDQELCEFLNHKEIKDTSLEYFYNITMDATGILTKIIKR